MRISRPSSKRAQAPRGSRQPPPRAMSTARSAAAAIRVCRWSTRAQTAAASPPLRVSMAIAPWHGAGTKIRASSLSLMRPAAPMRSRPAQARSSPSTSPSSSLRSRVSTLPRSGTTISSGCNSRRKAARRALPVPMEAPLSSDPSPRPSRVTRASRQSARSRKAATSSPAMRSLGRSLAECTAASARPSEIASSSAALNHPSPSSRSTGVPGRSSPWARMTTVSRASTPAPRSVSTARAACATARRLPRVASRRAPPGVTAARRRARRGRMPREGSAPPRDPRRLPAGG